MKINYSSHQLIIHFQCRPADNGSRNSSTFMIATFDYEHLLQKYINSVDLLDITQQEMGYQYIEAHHTVMKDGLVMSDQVICMTSAHRHGTMRTTM